MRRAGRHLVVAVVALAGAGGGGCVDVDDIEDRWSVVEVRPFEGAAIDGNTVECAGLTCANGVDPVIARFETSEEGHRVLRVGVDAGFSGTLVHLRRAPEAPYALVRVVSYCDVCEGDEHPVWGWVMLEEWVDGMVAVGRYELTVDDERGIRGTFDTRSSEE